MRISTNQTFDILGLSLEVIAAVGISGENRNVSPWAGVPVRIVVALFRTLKTISAAIVLASSLGIGILTAVLVSDPETTIAVSLLTLVIVFERFVHSTVRGVLCCFINSLGGNTITQERVAHELENDLAVNLVVICPTTVLVGPFNLEKGFFVIGQRRTPVVTT